MGTAVGFRAQSKTEHKAPTDKQALDQILYKFLVKERFRIDAFGNSERTYITFAKALFTLSSHRPSLQNTSPEAKRKEISRSQRFEQLFPSLQ